MQAGRPFVRGTLVWIFMVTLAGAGYGQDYWADRFSDEAIVLLPPLRPAGTNASEAFTRWDIRFSSGLSGFPVAGTMSAVETWPGPPPVRFLSPPPAPFDASAVINGVPGGEEAGALTVHFDSPVQRVHLTLSAEATVTGRVRVFGAESALFGSLQGEITGPREGGSASPSTSFFLEDPEGRAIHQVEVEYSDPSVPEALLAIYADFVETPAFLKCIPQVAHGSLVETDETLQTQLNVTNPVPGHEFWLSGLPQPITHVSLSFHDPAGDPLIVFLDGATFGRSQFSFNLQSLRSVFMKTTDAAFGLDTGYACAASNYPLELAAVYRVIDSSGQAISETGIDGIRPARQFVGVFERELNQDSNTGLALANVSDKLTTVGVTFLMAPSTTFNAEVQLGPGEQGAWFVDELTSDLADRDARGTVWISADQTIAATILRTLHGVVTASLPLTGQ